MKTIVSEKGQITIPKALRDRLGVKSGTVLSFRAEAGRLIAEKEAAADPLDKWVGRGKLPFGKDGDAYLEALRER